MNDDGTPVPYLVQLNTPNAQGTPDVATAPISFSANTNQGAGSTISWTLPISYLAGYVSASSSPVFGGPTPQATPTFDSTSGNPTSYSFQSMGGQVFVEAQASMPGGDSGTGTVTDCETFYVEGPEAPPGIPDSAITTFLTNIYHNDAANFPEDGTKNLMTGIAMKESSYAQFYLVYNSATPPKQLNDDLWGLVEQLGMYFNNDSLEPFWPQENMIVTPGAPRGSHIGLMMVRTQFNDAWNWQTNAIDGEKISADMLAYAEADEMAYTDGVAYSLQGLPALSAVQLENMALAMYVGDARSSSPSQPTLNRQYYVPVCHGGARTIAVQGPTCPTGWVWEENIGPGKTGGSLLHSAEIYIAYVRTSLQY